MSFLSPVRLLLLLAVAALLAVYLVQQRRRSVYAVRWTNLALLDSVAPQGPGWRKHLPAAAFLTMALLLVTAFAQPTREVQVPRERATVVVAIDVSLSMNATDVAPSRIDAAKTAARSFVDGLPKSFNVALVSFSGTAVVVVPPTQDHGRVEEAIGGLVLGPRTAIGDALVASLSALSAAPAAPDGSPPPGRIVLMSDGTSTVGTDLATAAQDAVAAGVPVSTIAYGTPNGVVEADGQRIPVPVDAESLAALASATGGTSFRATSGDELERVYRDIGSSVGYRTETRDLTGLFLGLGLLAGLAAAAGSLRWFSRLP